MDNNIKSISTDLFYKIRSRFSGLQLGLDTGEVTINPEEAVFFDFDYSDGDRVLGHISISLAEPTSMKVYFSSGITDDMETDEKNHWYDFLKSMRFFAKRRLLNFDARDISKDNLDTRDFKFLSQYNKEKNNIGESIMKEGMYGSPKTSYQKLDDCVLIIKHKKAVDENVAGSRSRNISALFIQNEAGERFKYPFIHLAGARAMQRHVANGGVPYDDVGKYIIELSEQIAKLKSFESYVVRNDLMNTDTNGIVDKTSFALNELRSEVNRLSKQHHYSSFKENFQTPTYEEIPEDVIADLTNKFTVKQFNEELKDVFPIIHRIMKSESVVYDDIIEMTQEISNTDIDTQCQDLLSGVNQDRVNNEFAAFESWVSNLGEEANTLLSDNPRVQEEAISKLNDLFDDVFPVGVDGVNAIESLEGIIDDPALFNEIKVISREDSNFDARDMVYSWIEENAPNVLQSIESSENTEEQPTIENLGPYSLNLDGRAFKRTFETYQDAEKFVNEVVSVKYPEVQCTITDSSGCPCDDKNSGQDIDTGEMGRLAESPMEIEEFVRSFYNKEDGTFPLGEEGVVTKAVKEFSNQETEEIARDCVKNLSQRQENPLGRLVQLAGL